jgi:biopolymer transport protein ExbD
MARIKRPPVSNEIPQASLADIAFLLLIFFISTTVFNVEEGLTLILPPRAAGARKQVTKKNVLVLRTDDRDQVTADGLPVGDPDAISDLVAGRLHENPKLVVSIETSPQARYRTMIKVLDEVKEAEAPRISIKTAGPPDAAGR